MPDQSNTAVNSTPDGRSIWQWMLNRFKLGSHGDSGGDSDKDKPGPLDKLEELNVAKDRGERYRIFEEMSSYGYIDAFLSTYAEETTQTDAERGKVAWLTSKNSKMVAGGEICLSNIQVENRAFAIVYEMCQLGDSFRRNVYQSAKGILNQRPIEAKRMVRVSDKYDRLVGFRESGVKFRKGTQEVSWPWDYTHWRLLGKGEKSGYGTALCDMWYRPWQALTMLENDGMMRDLKRADDRNLIILDTQNLADDEQQRLVNKVQKKASRREFLDPANKQYSRSYNASGALDDIVVAVRGTNSTTVEKLSGSGPSANMNSIDYYRKQLFGVARIPPAYLGYDGDLNGRSALSQQDVRFARTAKKVRRSFVQGLRATIDTHFLLMGPEFDPTDDDNRYVIQMSPISFIDELERGELLQMRVNLLSGYASLGAQMSIDVDAWTLYLLVEIAKLPEAVALQFIRKGPPDQPPGSSFPPSDGSAPATTPDASDMQAGLESIERRFKLRRGALTESGYAVNAYDVNTQEKRAIWRVLSENQWFADSIAGIAGYLRDDADEIHWQTDPSLYMPTSMKRDKETKNLLVEDELSDEWTQLQKETKSIIEQVGGPNATQVIDSQ